MEQDREGCSIRPSSQVRVRHGLRAHRLRRDRSTGAVVPRQGTGAMGPKKIAAASEGDTRMTQKTQLAPDDGVIELAGLEPVWIWAQRLAAPRACARRFTVRRGTDRIRGQ